MSLITMQPYEFTAQGSYADDFYCRVSWADDADNATNTSRPVITALQFKSKYWSPECWVNGTIKADGVTIIEFSEFRGTHSVDITKNAGYAPVTAHGDNPNAPWYGSAITHGNDGSKSITLEVNLYLRSTGGDLRINFYDSRAVSLAQIPRASTVGVADGSIEGVATISVNRKSTQYTHTLQYIWGSVSGYINEDGYPVGNPVKMTAAGIPFHIPPTFYKEIPRTTYGIGSIICRTYSGNTLVGEKSAQFTAYTTEERCRPQITGSAYDVNPKTVAVTGNNKRIVRYMSTIHAELSATPKNGASLKSASINGTPGETATFPKAQDGNFTYSAMDSRDYTSTAQGSLEIIPYVKVTVNIDYDRPEPTGSEVVIKVNGNYFSGSFGAVGNTLNLSYKLDGSTQAPIKGASFGNDTYSAQFTLQLPYTENHTIEVIASDMLTSANSVEDLSRGLPNFAIFRNNTTFYKSLSPSGGLYDVTIYISNDPSRDFNTELEEVYRNMENGTIRFIRLGDYPAIKIGGWAVGFISKTVDDWGFLICWSYYGHKLYKLKQNGVWTDWVVGGM